MKLAETARTRWVLALVSVAFGATAIIAASRTCSKPAVAKTATQVKPWRECHQRKVVQQPRPRPAAREVSGEDYREKLMAVRPALEACMSNQPAGVTYTIRANIVGDGSVESVEVRGEDADLSKVDLHVVKCMERTMSRLRFPATHTFTAVSTTLVTPPSPTVISR
jgi:hypothetical protein